MLFTVLFIIGCMAIFFVYMGIKISMDSFLEKPLKKYKPDCMKDRTVVITGGFNDIGQYTQGWVLVTRFVFAGADVIFINNNRQKSQGQIEFLKNKLEMSQILKYIHCNLNEFTEVQKVKEKLDGYGIIKIDVLICNSDGLLSNANKDNFEKDYDRYFKMNQLCNVYLALQLQDFLRKGKEARVINFSTIPKNYKNKGCKNQALTDFDDKVFPNKLKMKLFEISKLYSVLATKGWAFYTKRKNAFNLRASERFDAKSVCLNPRTNTSGWVSFLKKIMQQNKISHLKELAHSVEYKAVLLKTETIFFVSITEFGGLKDGSCYKDCQVQTDIDRKVSSASALFWWNKSIETIKKYIPNLEYI